jgi:hypothetical protein
MTNTSDNGGLKSGLLTMLQLLPVLFSALLIAAHFLRTGNLVLVVVSLVFPLLLLIRRAFAARLVQAGLLLAALEWMRTAILLADLRSSVGYPWIRMTVILSVVAVFTLGSLFVFLSKTLRARYNLSRVN